MFSNSDLKNSKTISSPSPLYGTLLTISFLGYSQFKIFLIKSLIFFLNRFLINVFENGHFPQFRISLRWCRTISTRLSCFAVVDVPGKISAIHLDSAVRTRPLEISWLLFYSKGVVRWNISEMKYPWDEISVRRNIEVRYLLTLSGQYLHSSPVCSLKVHLTNMPICGCRLKLVLKIGTCP